MLITPHRNCVSLKNTIIADKNIPIPSDSANKHPMPKGNSRIDGRIGVLVINKTIRSGISDSPKLIVEDMTLVSG